MLYRPAATGPAARNNLFFIVPGTRIAVSLHVLEERSHRIGGRNYYATPAGEEPELEHIAAKEGPECPQHR